MSETFTRNTDHKVVAGVCAGIAEHFGWSKEYTRLGYLALSVFGAGFPGVLLYIILWVAMPAR